MKLIHATQTIDAMSFTPVVQMTVELDLENILDSHAFMSRDELIKIFGERFLEIIEEAMGGKPR